MHLMNFSRPDIAYAMCRLSRYTHNLNNDHWSALARLMKYLRGTMNYGIPLQEIHSLPTKIIDGLNFVGNYRRNIDGTRHIVFSTFLLPFIDGIPINNYQQKCSVGNFPAVCRRQILGTIYRQNTYEKLPTKVVL